MDILRKQLHGKRQVSKGEMAADMVHQIHQDAVCHGPHRLPGSPAGANQQLLVKELVNARDEPVSQVCREDVASSNQQLSAKLGHLLGTVFEEGEHALDHVGSVLGHLGM